MDSEHKFDIFSKGKRRTMFFTKPFCLHNTNLTFLAKAKDEPCALLTLFLFAEHTFLHFFKSKRRTILTLFLYRRTSPSQPLYQPRDRYGGPRLHRSRTPRLRERNHQLQREHRRHRDYEGDGVVKTTLSHDPNIQG